MGKSVRITGDNVDLFEAVLSAFRDDLENLAAMTKRYPVECTFGEYRFVFARRSDIEELIGVLDRKITDFRAAA